MNGIKTRIYFVDDHKLFIEGVTSLLTDDQGLEIIGYSFTARDFIAKIDELDIDAYIIDINMPDMSGLELAQKIKEKKPHAQILILSMYDSYEYIENAIKSGASGYLLKAANHEELVKAIKIVARGEQYFGMEILRTLTRRISSANQSPDEDIISNRPNILLSKRETEILILITQEYTTQKIAEKLFISERTVETHRKNILSKTGVKSIVGLIKYAIDEGIIIYNKDQKF
jgi:DNA-binding NarL/FixJ family response regulator